MKKLKKLFYVIPAFLLAAGLTLAQDESSKMDNSESQVQQGDEKFVDLAENLATDLKDRVDLREDQVEQVQNILVEYFAEVEPISSSSSMGSNMESGAVSDPGMSGSMQPDHTGVGMDASTMGNYPTGSNTYPGVADTTDKNHMYGSDTTDTSGNTWGSDTSDTDSNYGTDTSSVSGSDFSSDQTRTEGTGVGETGTGGTGTGTGSYGDKANVLGQSGNMSGSSSVSTNGTNTSTMNDADALGDAFEARQKADNRIMEVLDEEQKKDYASEKGEWWSEIQDKFESA
jgi:hypothetical protein